MIMTLIQKCVMLLTIQCYKIYNKFYKITLKSFNNLSKGKKINPDKTIKFDLSILYVNITSFTLYKLPVKKIKIKN